MEGFLKLLILMLLGGLIAYLGDRTGKYIGKKKLTIFNLRPRYTSQIFTVLFGMLISLMTLSILAAISRDARQALFEVHQLESKRQKLEQDIANLTKLTTLNEVVFHINQPIVMGQIQGGAPRSEIDTAIEDILSKANQVAIQRTNEAGKMRGLQPLNNETKLVLYQKSDHERLLQELSKNSKNFVAIVYALKNTYLHEQVLVQFDLRENKKIYSAGEKILSVNIDGNESSDQILVDLFNLLSQLQQAALNAGMIPDPVTNNFGGNLLVATLFGKRDQIKQISGPSKVDVIANRNLYTSGPLDVNFVVHTSGG